MKNNEIQWEICEKEGNQIMKNKDKSEKRKEIMKNNQT
jgi:hypothetical protein